MTCAWATTAESQGPFSGLSRLPVVRRHLEAGKLEARRHGAAGQGPGAEAGGALPEVGGHHHLRLLAEAEVGAQHGAFGPTAVRRGDVEVERLSGVEMPDLDRIGHPVPVRALARLEQV